MKARSKVILTAAGVVMAGVVVAAPMASSAPMTKSFAYGFSANGEGKQPYVESTDGSTQTTGGEVPDNPLLSGGVLSLAAGDDQASVQVADLTIGGALAQLPPEVTDGLSQLQAACDGLGELPIEDFPEVIGEIPLPLPEQPTEDDLIAFCNGVFDGNVANLATVEALDVACDGDSGTVTMGAASLLGAESPLGDGAVEPNTALFPDNPLLSITLNRQTQNADGSFTVDGMVIEAGPGGEGEVVLASTTCGVPIDAQQEDTPNPAPTPTPVPGDIPVTG